MPLVSKIHFFFILVSVFLLNTIRFPSLILYGEPYAETGKIYFHLANHYSLFENLMFADGTNYPSYYPILGRIISWLTLKLPMDIGIYYFPNFVNALGLILISIFVSLFYLSISDKKFSINKTSALLFSIILTLHYDIGLFFLFNLGYLSIFLGLYFLFFNPENLNRLQLLILSLFGFLTLMSKPYFIAFLPFYFLLLILSIYKKKINSSFFYFSLLIPLTILFYSLNTASNLNAKTGIVKLPLSVLLEKTLYFTYYSLSYSIFGVYNFTNSFFAFILSAFFWITLFTFVVILLKRRKYKSIVYSISLLFMSVICTALNVIAFKHSFPIKWEQVYTFPDNSHFLFTFVLSVTAFFILFSSIFKSNFSQLIFISIFSTSSACFGYLYSSKDPFLNGNKARSNWKNYSVAMINSIKKGSYCIPINPDALLTHRNDKDIWMVNRNCKLLSEEVTVINDNFTQIISNTNDGAFVNGVELVLEDEKTKSELNLVLIDKNQKVISNFSPIFKDKRPFIFFNINTELKNDFSLAFKNSGNLLVKIKSNDLRVFGCPLSNRKCYELLSINYFNY